jgi:glycosyltransferase involved in cell wall biosynthesis
MKRLRVAYFGYPHTGGTYSVFKMLRRGMVDLGADLEWLGITATDETAETRVGGVFERELAEGRFVGSADDSENAAASGYCRHVDEEGYDAVIVNVLANKIQMNAVRYIRPSVARLMVVHSITPATYLAAGALRDFVHGTIAVSPRIQRDLSRKHGFPAETISVVPTGIDMPSAPSRPPRPVGPLRVLYLGRIRDYDKGVLWIPRIAQRLAGEPIRIRIAGDGDDMPRLKAAIASFSPQVELLGRVEHRRVPELLLESDVMLMPSRFEGLPVALVEAMACGVVPVASRISGVTDFVSPHGDTGFLFDVGDVEAAAERLRELARSPELVNAMSARARERAATQFGIANMAQGYHAALTSCIARATDQDIRTLPVAAWTYPKGLQPGMRSRLPMWLKNHLRVLRERMA